MKKITITIPKNQKDKWMLGLGERPRSMARADTLLNRLERVLSSRLILKEKMAIRVKMGKDTINESCASSNTKYLLWVTVCFLEDYLSKTLLRAKHKKYEEEEP